LWPLNGQFQCAEIGFLFEKGRLILELWEEIGWEISDRNSGYLKNLEFKMS
jgi:hypothetical protein